MTSLSRSASIILRPPINDYEDSELLSEVSFDNDSTTQSVPRVPFLVKSREGYDMPASLYRVEHPAPGNPVLIFSHGNGQNQRGAFWIMPVDDYLKLGISVCLFDFAGCGKGNAPLITMGFREKGELGSVVDYMKSNFGFQKVILWGFSMGAFTTFLTLAERSDISVAVCDATLDTVGNFLRRFTNSKEYDDTREEILQKGGFDIELVDAVAVATRVTTPVTN
jgi:pimeloyl-ACP methyl ester carboxylesterase